MIFEPGDPPTWTTAQGQFVPVREMTSTHIRNTMVRLMSRYRPEDEYHVELRHRWIKIFEKELNRRARKEGLDLETLESRTLEKNRMFGDALRSGIPKSVASHIFRDL